MRSARIVLFPFTAGCVPVKLGDLSPGVGLDGFDRLNHVLAALYGVPRALELADVAMQLHHRMLKDAVLEDNSAARVAA